MELCSQASMCLIGHAHRLGHQQCCTAALCSPQGLFFPQEKTETSACTLIPLA